MADCSIVEHQPQRKLGLQLQLNTATDGHQADIMPYDGRLFVGSRAASFKRPLLSIDVSVCLSVCLSAALVLNISETKRFSDSYPIVNQ